MQSQYITVVPFLFYLFFCDMKNVKSIFSLIVSFIIYFQFVPLKLKKKDM